MAACLARPLLRRQLATGPALEKAWGEQGEQEKTTEQIQEDLVETRVPWHTRAPTRLVSGNTGTSQSGRRLCRFWGSMCRGVWLGSITCSP